MGAVTYYVRTAGAPETMLSTVRRVVEHEAPGTPVSRFCTMEEQADQVLGTEKQMAMLAGAFGGLAISLPPLASTAGYRTQSRVGPPDRNPHGDRGGPPRGAGDGHA